MSDEIKADDIARMFNAIEDHRKKNPPVVVLRVVFGNRKAVRALRVVLETLESVAEDFAYRDDVRRAVKAARYATKHLTVSK